MEEHFEYLDKVLQIRLNVEQIWVCIPASKSGTLGAHHGRV